MKRTNGFTLIELMVTIAVASILMGIGAPMLSDQLKRSRISGVTRDLVEDMAIARSEAVTRALNVSVCASQDGSTCSNDSWATGRIVFVDQGTLGTIDAGDVVIKQSAAPQFTLTATPSGAASAGFITFLSGGGVAAASTIDFCVSGAKPRDVDINTLGRVATEEGTTPCP